MSTLIESPAKNAHSDLIADRHPLHVLRELLPRPRVILDCGGGDGSRLSFSRQARNLWPRALIHSFEPASRFNQTLQPVDDRHVIHRCALGAEDGEGQLNLTYGPQSNSLLEYLPDGPLAEIHKEVGHETVLVRALDSIIATGIDRVDLLKLDVQGAELQVLQGAKELIAASTPVIFCEVAFQRQYRGQPLLENVDQYLAFLGYRRHSLYASPMPDIWGDAIYVPVGIAAEAPDSHPESIRLNIGAGDTVIPGFTPIDRKFGTEAYPLPHADGSVAEIRCVHMFEHLSYAESMEALAEWFRVLQPGGRLRISVPDVDKILPLASDGQYDPMWRFYLMGGQTDANDFHKSAWDYANLHQALAHAGFERIDRWTSANTDLAASDISLNLEGFKPSPNPETGLKQAPNSFPEARAERDVAAAPSSSSVDIKIRAVCGMPRIGWNDSWQTIVDAMGKLSIPIETHQGCFWAQNMQNALTRALNDGIDWVFTLDYDSLILPAHVEEMIDIFSRHPEIDALAALQMRRGQETPLFSTGKTSAEIDGTPLRVNTAHFGLTLLRVDRLARIAKPWLIDVPDEQGEYSGQHVDADITFWKKWTAAGFNVFVAPNVRIGHLELLVSEFDEHLKPRHFHIGQWWNRQADAGKTNKRHKRN